MNKARRAEIAKVADEIDLLKERIEEIQSEEQEYLDNMPESLQESDKGDAAQQAIDALEESLTSLDEVKDHLETASE